MQLTIEHPESMPRGREVRYSTAAHQDMKYTSRMVCTIVGNKGRSQESKVLTALGFTQYLFGAVVFTCRINSLHVLAR